MIKRYETLMKSALEVQQKRKEIEQLLRTMAENITAKELKTRYFDKDAAKDATVLLTKNESISVNSSTHVQATAFYKDVEVYLHCEPNPENGNKIMKRILEGIESKDILNV